MEEKDLYDAYGNIQFNKYYHKKFGVIGNFLNYEELDGKKVLEQVKSLSIFTSIYDHNEFSNSKINDIHFSVFISETYNVLVICKLTYISVYYKEHNYAVDVLLDLKDKHPKINKLNNINIIGKANGEFYLQTIEISSIELDIDKNYNDDFKEIDGIIKTRLNKEFDKGVILLHGVMGSGKTTYIRHLINTVKKRIIFVPPSLVDHLSDPELIPFFIRHPNSVLVIEDAENAIMERSESSGNSVSNLLNISDGLLSDILNIQILCTFNSDITTIDKALLRKGRIIAKYEFKELSVDKCNIINKELNKSNVNKPMTLADLYNQGDNDYVIIKKEIGF